MTQSTLQIGPQLRFRRFPVKVSYVLRSTIRRNGSFIEEDAASESLRRFLDSFSQTVVYLPVDKSHYLTAAAELLYNARIPKPIGFDATPQYLINSQLLYIARRSAPRRWSVDREVFYGEGSKFRSDLRVMATPCEDGDHEPFSIWFESDNANEVTLRRKLGERVSVIGQSDTYVSVIYANSQKNWSRIPRAASLLAADMDRKSTRCSNAFAVLSIDPPSICTGIPNVEVDAHLLLDGQSVRVAEFHFGGPDSWGRNEFVTDEKGRQYPHRDPPPPLPKPSKLRGLRDLLSRR